MKKLKLTRFFGLHSTAELRAEMRLARTNRWMRCAIYGELLKRRRSRRRR